MKHDPVFLNYAGLVSFTDPVFFDNYVHEVVFHLERYVPCVIVTGHTRSAHIRFMRGVATFKPEQIDLWLWMNLLTNAIREKLRVKVDSIIDKSHSQYQLVQLLALYPAHAIVVGLGVATIRAEFGIPMEACQISLNDLASLTERLGEQPELWMFDQTDILGACAGFVVGT